MPGLLLGLSTGVTCIATCAPALFPYIIGDGRDIKGNILITLEFLAGRLAGYMIFAALAWLTGRIILENFRYHNLFYGAAYLLLATTLFVFGFRKPKMLCAGGLVHTRWTGGAEKRSGHMPLSIGFLTGLNLCPPFLLAFTGAAGSGSLWGSLLFFAEFFVGTSLFFIPTPFLGMLGKHPNLRQIGRWAAAIVGVYYSYLGLVTLIEGVVGR